MTNQTNDNPGELSPPPPNLSQRELPLKVFSTGVIFARIHKLKNNPIYFSNSSEGRFNTPEGVMYLGIDEYVAFRETIGRFSKYSLISREELEIRGMVKIKSSQNLSLVDITGRGLTLLSADNRLSTGNYKIAQQWSKALQDHPSSPDGIYYCSRHDPSRFCLALYQQKTKDILQVVNSYELMSDNYSINLANILDEYEYGLK